MALARKEEFSRRENSIADFAKLLSHPARLAILMKLAEQKECICGDFVLDLPLAQSTVSQHLKALKEMGLIKGSVEGPKSMYCIDWQAFEKYQLAMTAWMKKLEDLKANNCC